MKFFGHDDCWGFHADDGHLYHIDHGIVNLNAHPLDENEFHNGRPLACVAYVSLQRYEQGNGIPIGVVTAWGGGA